MVMDYCRQPNLNLSSIDLIAMKKNVHIYSQGNQSFSQDMQTSSRLY